MVNFYKYNYSWVPELRILINNKQIDKIKTDITDDKQLTLQFILSYIDYDTIR